MAQVFPLDRARRRLYYPLVAIGLVCACARYRSIAIEGLAPLPLPTAAHWADEFAPTRSLRIDLRWRFENQQGQSAGRAVVRLAPPDTLRFDYRGPFGKSGSALIVGNTARWAHPEQDFENLIPVAPLFWAALGVPGTPPAGVAVFGREQPRQRAWRYVDGEEEIDFIHVLGPNERLLAELRYRNRVLGFSEVQFAGGPRQPVRATMIFPGDASRFSFTIEAIDTVAAFDPQTWSSS